MWDPRIYFAAIEASKFKFVIQLGLEHAVAYQETTFTTKTGGGLAREH